MSLCLQGNATSVAVDFGGKRLRFWSRGFVCHTKKVNACGHIPVCDLTMVVLCEQQKVN